MRTPRGKVDVILFRGGKSRAATWGAQTEISVARAAQGTLPGAEPITAAEHASRLASAPLRPTVAQRPADFGLFGDSAAQLDLVDMARTRYAERHRAKKAPARVGDRPGLAVHGEWEGLRGLAPPDRTITLPAKFGRWEVPSYEKEDTS